jgi:hypothetical protein
VGVLQLAASAITHEFAAKLQSELARLPQSSTVSPAEPDAQSPKKPLSPLRLIWQMFVQWLGWGADRAQR